MTTALTIEGRTYHFLEDDQTFRGPMPMTAGLVLQLLSGVHVPSGEPAPAGFEIAWNRAATAGAFANCGNVGDYLRAYLKHQLAMLDEEERNNPAQ